MRFRCPFCQGIVAVPNTDMGIECQCGHCSEIVTVPSYRLSTGAVIADFIILEELGRGGMGIVFLAHQMTLDRPAALKILSDVYAGDPEFVVDFIKEARAAAKLNHPHIVQAYAVGEDEGVFFFAMEHIDGETMKTYLKREGLVPIDFALEVIQQIAEALDYAWKEQRLIHRDIKPDNIMLTKNGRAKLADLGLARIAGEIDDSDSDEVMGTPQYISPEHLTGAEMDVRSDIYSLGATLFHILTGRFAFEGKTATDIARKHLEEPLINPQQLNPNISSSICDIIFKMMEKDSNDRYQNAADLVEDLNLVRKGKATSLGGPAPSKKSTKQFLSKRGGKTMMMKTSSSVTGIVGSKKSFHNTGSHLAASRSNLITGTDHILSNDEIQKQKEAKAKNQLIIIAALFVVGIFIAAIFFFINSQPEEAVATASKLKKTKKTVVAPKINKDPQTTQYTKEVAEILEFARKFPSNGVMILTKCDLFFIENPTTKYKCEERSLQYLLDVYVPIDEKRRIVKARERLHKKHLLILKNNSEAHEDKLAAKARKDRAATRLQREKDMKLDRAKKEKERLKDYQESLAKSKIKLIYRALYYSFSKKYKQAIAVFSSAIKEADRVSDLKKADAIKYAEWAKKIQSSFSIAEKTWSTLYNAGKKLNGLQIEIKRGALGKITNIKNGNVTAKTFAGKSVTVPLSRLSIKQFKKIVDKTATLIDIPDATYFYMLYDGEFKEAKEACPVTSVDDFEEIVVAYLRTRIKFVLDIDDEDDQKKERIKLMKYRRMPEFKKARKLLKEEESDDSL